MKTKIQPKNSAERQLYKELNQIKWKLKLFNESTKKFLSLKNFISWTLSQISPTNYTKICNISSFPSFLVSLL